MKMHLQFTPAILAAFLTLAGCAATSTNDFALQESQEEGGNVGYVTAGGENAGTWTRAACESTAKIYRELTRGACCAATIPTCTGPSSQSVATK